MDRNVCLVLFAIFMAYTARDLFFPTQSNQQQSDQDPVGPGSDVGGSDRIKKEIPSMSFRTVQSGPTIKILYCYSCGYQRAFEEYRKMIQERFPDLQVIGNNYNPSWVKAKLCQLISIAKMVIITMLFANVDPFAYLGMPMPQFWIWMREHKLYASLMAFFLSNTLESQLMSSGAFEIFYNDVPIWSKLTTGRIPSPPELFDMINSQHKFYQTEMFRDTLSHTMAGPTL